MSLEIDIRQFVIIALGGNEFLYQDIDDLYNLNKDEYFKAYKDSNYYNSRLFKTFTTMKEQHIKKVAGIVQLDYRNDTFEHTHKLIKKGYKFVWNFVQHRKTVNAQELALVYSKKKGNNNVLEMEILNLCIIAMYLCMHDNKTFDTNNHVGETVMRYLEETLMNVYVNEINFTEKDFQEHRSELEELKKRFFVDKQKTISLELIFENIIQSEMEQISKQKTFYDFHSLRSASFKEGISSYIGAYSGWLKVLNIHESDIIASTVLTNEDIDKVFLEYIIAKKENSISESERNMFIISTFYLKAIADEYKKTKEVYLTDLTEEFYYDLNKAKEEIKEQKQLVQYKEQTLQFEQKRLENERTALSLELDDVTKERNHYKSQLEEQENNRKELIALREFMFSLQSKDYEEETEDDKFNQQVEYLQKQRCVIIGGHTNWVNKMKDLYPTFIYVNPDNKGLDLSFLDNPELHVIYNTATNNHSFYEKAMKRMANNDTPLYYINGNNNIRITTNSLYKSIQH